MFRADLHSEIAVDASPDDVWRVLTAFDDYRDWNPVITRASGRANAGSTLDIVLQWPGLRQHSYRLQILAVRAPHELRWLGHFIVPGLLDGDHSFVIESAEDGRVRVIQSERFRGVLVPVFRRWLRRNVLNGFQLMNEALRDRAEAAARAVEYPR